MITSGSLTPGVDPAQFGLTPFAAMRIEVPATPLRPYVSRYHVYDSEGPQSQGVQNWVLPSWSSIQFILADNPIRVRADDRLYDPMPPCALFGTTTRAMRMTTHGGVTIGATITPLGWARLFTRPARTVRDRIVPLQTMMDPALVDSLHDELAASDRALDVKPIFDRFFTTHMLPPHRDEMDVRTLKQLIADPATRDLGHSARSVGISESRLRRLSLAHFGYSPKTLLMRTRFMRVFLPMLTVDRQSDFSRIGNDYVDASHFLRDARRFIGTTPARFMAAPTPYLDAELRAHRLVFEAAARAEGKA